MARTLAGEAGRLLLALRDGAGLVGAALGQEGDRAANALIVEALRARRPADAVLSEEGRDDLSRLAAMRVWLVDPLDGTAEFARGGNEWAVHVGLALDGGAYAGAVAAPALGWAMDSATAEPPPPRAAGPVRIVISRDRPPPQGEMLARALGGVVRPMASAGVKTLAVALGEADLYVHAGGQYEWDNCAPAAVAIAAGLHVSRLCGAPLQYNKADPVSPDLLICRKELAQQALAALAAAG